MYILSHSSDFHLLLGEMTHDPEATEFRVKSLICLNHKVHRTCRTTEVVEVEYFLIEVPCAHVRRPGFVQELGCREPLKGSIRGSELYIKHFIWARCLGGLGAGRLCSRLGLLGGGKVMGAHEALATGLQD